MGDADRFGFRISGEWPPSDFRQLNRALVASCMDARGAIFLLAVLLLGGSGGFSPASRAGLALGFEKSQVQSKKGAEDQAIHSQPKATPKSCTAFEEAPRISYPQKGTDQTGGDVVLPILQDTTARDGNSLLNVLQTLETSSMGTSKIEIKEGWILWQKVWTRQRRQGPFKPIRSYEGSRFQDGNGTLDSIVTFAKNSSGQTGRSGKGSREIGQRVPTEAPRWISWTASDADSQGSTWGTSRGQGSNPESDRRQHSRCKQSSAPRAPISSGKLEADCRQVPKQTSGSRRRVGFIHRKNEREVCSAAQGLPCKQGADFQGIGGEVSAVGRGNVRLEEESCIAKRSSDRLGATRGSWRGNISMGHGARLVYATRGSSGRHYQDCQPTEQEGQAREVREAIGVVLGPYQQSATSFEKDESQRNRTVPQAPNLKAARNSSGCTIFFKFSQLLREEPEWQAYDMTLRIVRRPWESLLSWIMSRQLVFLPVIIVGQLALLLFFFLWETGEDTVTHQKTMVKVSKRRATARKRIMSKGMNWLSIGLHYLLWWHHVGALAGNTPKLPMQPSFSAPAQSESFQEGEQEFLDVFRQVRDRRFHIFELWMHKPTWNNGFVNCKKLMSIDIEKPHVTQIKNSWRTKENWMSYEFVKVTLPSALENFQGFLGQRYLAYPEGNLGRIPILAYFNGILKVMTGTVWPRGTAQGVSIVELMEIIEPNHLCGERHLCSVQAESLSFWPEAFQARPGSYIHVKQVNIDDDSEEEGTSSTSSCSTRWHESFGENGTSSAEDEQVRINNEEAFIHEEQNLNETEDSNVMMQVQSSAGVFPERMRERSNALWERTMAVHHEQQRQWAHERETVENTLNQELIMEEINGLALRNQGHVTCYLMGIANYQIGTRVINVNVWDLQDFVDLGVLIKRQWNDHANFGEWNLHFVDPQPPPEVHQNWDGITLICDLIPNHQNMPIAILTTTHYGAEDNSMDLSVHRARLLLNCRHLQEVSGVRMLCLHNAECSCMYASRPVTDSTPIIALAGYRIDVKIDMHIGRCDGEALLQGGEETSLMQLEGRPTTRSGPWVYGYPLLAEDVIRAWKGAIGDSTPQRLLANEHARHRQLMHHQIRVYRVFPIPVDLAEANIEAYVLAAEDDFEIWKVIILVDLYWEHTSMEGTGGSSAPIDQWRATRAIDYQLDVTTFLRQMGVLAFCGENLEFCEVMIRGNPWTQGTLHFHSGEFVVVRISRAHTTIPLGTQWQLSSTGCTFEDMPARLGPPSTRTTEEETRSEEDGNQNQNNRTENREAPSSSRGRVNLAEDDQFTLMQRLPRESWFFVYLKGMHDPIAEKLTGVELEDPILALREKFVARFPDVPRNFSSWCSCWWPNLLIYKPCRQ